MPEPMPEERLREIEERASDATPDWWVNRQGLLYAGDYDSPVCPLMHSGGFLRCADAEFAASSREDVPALVAEVRRLRALLETPSADQIDPEENPYVE